MIVKTYSDVAFSMRIEFEYIAITTEAMNRAAELWAEVRRLGRSG